MRAVAFLVLGAFLLISLPVSDGARGLKKPLCNTCISIVETVDNALEHGDDVEEAVKKFCDEDVPSFLSDMCNKIIAKSLEVIIEKLKDHESPEKICSSLTLCRSEL